MPGWLESLVLKLLLSLVEKGSTAVQNLVLDGVLSAKVKKTQKNRAEIIAELSAAEEGEVTDDELRNLHRRLRRNDSRL